jgi:RsiW-degrading membrane proteinase PrsW (M82 family)
MDAAAAEPDFVVRLAIVLAALGPLLPLGAILTSVGRRSFAPILIGYAAAGGLASAALSFLGALLHVALPKSGHPALEALQEAFVGAAIPEELAKFAVLMVLVLRHDDAVPRRDAILAAAWIGVGFAIFENFLYVTQAQEWLFTAALRATLAVPGHVSWGLIMGYFVARAQSGRGSYLPALAVPILLHGLYDAVLMYNQKLGEPSVSPGSIALFLAFVAVLVAGWLLIRGPVSAEQGSIDDTMPSEHRMPDHLARRWWIAGGLATLALILCVPAILLGAVAGAVWIDLRYAALAALAITPLAFVDLWRRV